MSLVSETRGMTTGGRGQAKPDHYDDMLSDARASADAYNRDYGGWEPTTHSYAPSCDDDGER